LARATRTALDETTLGDGADGSGRNSHSQASLALAHVVGARLKRLRLQRRLTLQEVAGSVDLSHSFLSMFERGQADISLGRINRLASFFGVPLGELLIDDTAGSQPRVIQADEGDVVERIPGMTLRLLPIGRALGLQVVHVVLAAGAGPSTPVSHDGEDFFWVLSGEIVLTYGVDEYRLKKGQSVVYAGRVHHFFSNRGRRPAELLSITSPPYGQIAAAPEGR